MNFFPTLIMWCLFIFSLPPTCSATDYSLRYLNICFAVSHPGMPLMRLMLSYREVGSFYCKDIVLNLWRKDKIPMSPLFGGSNYLRKDNLCIYKGQNPWPQSVIYSEVLLQDRFPYSNQLHIHRHGPAPTLRTSKPSSVGDSCPHNTSSRGRRIMRVR